MDDEYEEKESRNFWLSFFSAVGVLVILGAILFLIPGSKNSDKITNPGVQPGIGGGPSVISPSPSPSESPSEIPSIVPQKRG